MFCNYCGNQLDDGALFCTKCGKRVAGTDDALNGVPVRGYSQDGTISNSFDYFDGTSMPMGSSGNSSQMGAPRRKRNRKQLFVVLGIVAVIAAVAIAIGIGFFVNGTERKLQKQLDLGAKYIDELDYEQALAAYQAAIEIDPKCADAYIGAADAYIGLGDYEAAEEILEEGLEKTSDRSLQRKINRIQREMDADDAETTAEGKSAADGADAAIGREERPNEEETAIAEEVHPEEEIFMEFLHGERESAVGSGFTGSMEDSVNRYLVDDAETFSYEDLKYAVEYEMYDYIGEADAEDASRGEQYYAIVDSLAGQKILAVIFQGLGLYSPGDDSYVVFFFAVHEDALCLTYAYESWARSYVQIHEHLIMTGVGSGGAGDGYDWCGYIGKDGYYQNVYEMEILYEEWIAMSDPEDFSMDYDWSRGCVFYLITTSEGNYYAYETDGTADPEKLATYMQHLEASGMEWRDSVDEALDAAYAANGLTGETPPLFEDWIECP